MAREETHYWKAWSRWDAAGYPEDRSTSFLPRYSNNYFLNSSSSEFIRIQHKKLHTGRGLLTKKRLNIKIAEIRTCGTDIMRLRKLH